MNISQEQILWLLLLTGYVLIKDLAVPLVRFFIKKLNNRNGHHATNPISLDRFYQEFKDFKENKAKDCEKCLTGISKLDERVKYLETEAAIEKDRRSREAS